MRLAKTTTSSPQYTFGLQRAEVLGALINGISLITLSITIIIEAIQRFVEPVPMERPWLVFIVGTIGFLFNVIGMSMFHGNQLLLMG